MTVREVLDRVDELRPNAYSEKMKVAWLNECEGMVQTEVLLMAPEEMITYEPEDDEKELLVQLPHDKLYMPYVCAMIDFANGEYSKYQNTMQMFNAHFGEFMRWFATRYRPADTHE